MFIHRTDLAPLTLLAAVWILAVLLVNPVGDFPLNDDFSYGRSVYNLTEFGNLFFDKWLAMTLLSQVLWGAAFCKIFGFSFTVLRLSTLVLAYAGLAGSYLLFRDIGQSKRLSFFATLLLAFNPFFFSLSHTFMTDVPFFSFLMLSTLFYVKALRSGRLGWIAAGTFFALAAVFVRQLGMMAPAAFGVAWLFREKWQWKSILTALFPMVLTLALFFLYSGWLEASQGLPGGYGNFERLASQANRKNIFTDLFRRPGLFVTYLGLFFLPLSILLVKKIPVNIRSLGKAKAFMAAVLLFYLAGFLIAWGKMPWGNILYNFGAGPKLLKDGYYFINVFPRFSESVMGIIKGVAFAGAVLLLLLLLPAVFEKIKKQHLHRLPVIFALASIGLYTGFLMLDKMCFDRYFLQLMPFLLICLLPANASEIYLGKVSLLNILAIVLLGSQAFFSIAATHDYLSWNRARWQALDYLTKEKGATPHQIDGGFEFNGWHRPGERNYETARSWWWVDKDDFVVAFGDLQGFSKMKGFPFERWLPPGVDSVYILRHAQ